MRDIQDLRDALNEESAVVAGSIDLTAVRRRGRQIQRQRRALAATVVLAVGALAFPVVSDVMKVGRVGGSVAAISPAEGPAFLGEGVVTGAVLTAGRHEYDVVLGLAGTREDPAFTVAFRDSANSVIVDWDMAGLPRAADGNISGKRPNHPSHRFHSTQVSLGPGKLLDVGVFSGSAQRVTVESEGRTSDAAIVANRETGWTLFWVERDGKPLPPEAFMTANGYSGPESITVTAYSAGGEVLGTASSRGPVSGEDMSRIGGRVQSPAEDDGRPTSSDPAPATSVPHGPN